MLHVLRLGVPAHAIELHHHDVDGHGPSFMDWPCTAGYVRAIGAYPALYRNEVTVEAEDLAAACRTAIEVASESDAWKGHDCERPTYVAALAEGADVDPRGLTPEGADASVLPVPGLFTGVAGLAGYAATRSEDLVLQLRIMVDAIGDDGRLRIDPKAMVRLCATGRAMLDDIDRCGLPPKVPRSDEGGSGPACASLEAG